MAKLKEVQLKIKGIKKTKQITSAMKMVASSKLRSAQMRMESFRPYADKFAQVLGNLAELSKDDPNPLLTARETVQKTHIIICTSDRGLCGGFNANILSKVESFVKSHKDQELTFTAFGKKAKEWCKKNKHQINDEYIGIVGAKFGFNVAVRSGNELIQQFLQGTYDEVYIVYSEFTSLIKQTPIVKPLLPIPSIKVEETEESSYLAEHICEPSRKEVLSELLPRNIYIQIHRALLETSASEYAARMTAMDNATKACTDMLKELKRVYNKVRQSAITADLMDIVGGAEALKG
ncbi:MAG: ATP synthase F1 subunit gamma [Desulfobacterales bacterium]|nr:ATP synthase F1 subunit gamma [Desulfobacterales bacterium]